MSGTILFPEFILHSGLILTKLTLHHGARSRPSALIHSLPFFYSDLLYITGRFTPVACVSQTSPPIVFQQDVAQERHWGEIVGEERRGKPKYFSLPSLPWAISTARTVSLSCLQNHQAAMSLTASRDLDFVLS